MKCLSLMQPYAWLVATGRRRIELRTWNMHYRGKFLVHASKRTDRASLGRLGIESELVNGAVIGYTTIYGVKRYNSRDELIEDYALNLAGDYKIPTYGFLPELQGLLKSPVKMNSSLGFFDADITLE